MPCRHMLKVMDIFGYMEIPQQLIVKRWTRDAKAPLEGLSKQTRFCSICNGKGHKKTTCPDGDLPKQPRKEVKCSNCDVAGHKRIPAPTLRVSSCKQRLQPTARGASPSTNKSESGVVNWSRAPSISWPSSGVTLVLVWKTDSDAFYQSEGSADGGVSHGLE
ncbi:uncharacterized protein LOC119366356 [Triticum dicoccoides]|uniref:uncharacterized protein LOC119366356 n=1 Tax=Triticum dicoccoides TaxID=85692 RepID=UPI00188DCF90|nr:uncharacterized protein LOC119366356 [Triticum dicoccoides]